MIGASPQGNHKGPYKREAGVSASEREGVTPTQRSGRESLEKGTLLALPVEEGARSQERRWHSAAGKGKEIDSFPEPPEGTS